MPDERSEKERLRGEGFGKTFSKKWWDNFWYYYKKTVLIGICALLVIGFSVYEAATKVHPDTIVNYVGFHNFSDEQLLNMKAYFGKISSDANGDKKVQALLNRSAFDPSKAETDQSVSNQLETINLNLTVGDQVIYLMDKTCFDLFAGQKNDYFMDIRQLAKEYGIPDDKIVSSKGNTVGIDLTNSGMLKACKIDLPPDTKKQDNGVYMVIRKRRNIEKSDKAKAAIYDNNLNMAKKILATVEK